MTSAAIAARLGGAEVLHHAIESDLDLLQLLRDGLPASAVDFLVGQGALTAEELHSLVIPRRTLALRRQQKQTLTPEESDRVARVARVLAMAEETFADGDRSARWLRKPNRALAGQVPLQLLASELGGRMVEQALGRIAHGIFA